MSEKRNAIQTCINWANDSTNVFRQGTAEAAQRELAAYQAIAEAARDFMKVRPFVESIGDNLTNALLLRLVEALQAVDRKPGDMSGGTKG
jgi:hypothetical protein